MATLFKTCGCRVEHEPKAAKGFTLEEVRALIGGGYVRLVNLNLGPRGRSIGTLFVDEDGIQKGLAYNKEASELAGFVVYGDALVCHNHRRAWK
jgi:hypothetical protein